MMLISPLARKICQKKGIDPATLRGSGPRGRIMVRDLAHPRGALASRGKTVLADPTLPPTRAEKDGYYVFDGEVNMAALTTISMPIAVQCEKLLENRYSLFDYIVRAVVKAAITFPNWLDSTGNVNVLLFESGGERTAAITDAANKSIYTTAREIAKNKPVPEGFAPHIVVCDTLTSRAQVAAQLEADIRPGFAFVSRGQDPKDGIRAGIREMDDYVLKYTFYVSSTLSRQEACRTAARLNYLLYNPVSLLLLS